MSYCPACGKQVRDGAGFCGACGAAISKSAASSSRTPVVEAAPAWGGGGSPDSTAVVPLPPYAPAPPRSWAPAPPTAPMNGPAAGLSLSEAAARGQLLSWNGQPLNPGFAGRKLPAGILAIFFGTLGVHKFILGYTGAGIAMLAITIVCSLISLTVIGAFLGIPVISILALIALIEGIIYLTKSDDEFIQRYGLHHKSWF